MKTIHHSPVEKVIELFVSIISGCPDVKTINNRLVPDRLAAAAWCQRQFAEQSQVSEVLHRITPETLLQLEDVFQELFARQSLSRRHSPAEWLVVDVDMTGLVVSPTSKSYEGAAFGFMQKDKGKGYKLSCPYIGDPFAEVLGGLFDPGSAHCSTKLAELLLLIEKRVGSPPGSLEAYRNRIQQWESKADTLERRSLQREQEASKAYKPQRKNLLEQRADKLHNRAKLLRDEVSQALHMANAFQSIRDRNPFRGILIRGDAGFGAIENIILLSELKYDFLLKGYSPHTAALLAKEVPSKQWLEFTPVVSVAELGPVNLPGCPYPLRVVLGKTKTAKLGVEQYFHLITTIPKRMKDARTLLRFYNARQTIEAFIKTGKNVLNFKHFRVRNFYGIQFTLVLSLLAHNFMSWARRDIFAGTPLAKIGIREFVEQAMRVPARADIHMSPLRSQIPVTLFPETNVYARSLVEAIKRKQSLQLPLPFME